MIVFVVCFVLYYNRDCEEINFKNFEFFLNLFVFIVFPLLFVFVVLYYSRECAQIILKIKNDDIENHLLYGSV